MTNWFYQLEGQEALGPVPTETLKTLAKKGILKPTDLIWRDGYEKWVKAKRLQGLFPEKANNLPPIPDDRKTYSERKIDHTDQRLVTNQENKDALSDIFNNEFEKLNLDSVMTSKNNNIYTEELIKNQETKKQEPDFPPPLPKISDDTPVWYFSKGKNQYGPISTIEILRLASINQILQEDLVWNKEMTSWIAFSETDVFKQRLKKSKKLKINNKRDVNFADYNSDNLQEESQISFFDSVTNACILYFLAAILIVGTVLPWFLNVGGGGLQRELLEIADSKANEFADNINQFTRQIDILNDAFGKDKLSKNKKKNSYKEQIIEYPNIKGFSTDSGLLCMFICIILIGVIAIKKNIDFKFPANLIFNILTALLALIIAIIPIYHLIIFLRRPSAFAIDSYWYKPSMLVYITSDIGYGLYLVFFSSLFILILIGWEFSLFLIKDFKKLGLTQLPSDARSRDLS